MATTYTMANIVEEDLNTIRVFFNFSNGETNSNLFPVNATFGDIQAWAAARAIWFDEREVAIAEAIAALQAEGE